MQEDGLVAAMKVTTSAAMRARDVSRPHAEHLAYAEAAEASAASSRPAGPVGGPVPADAPAPANAAGTDAVPGDDEVLRDAGGDDWPAGARRRWRPRGSGRGRGSR
jgi:hypothetical protein